MTVTKTVQITCDNMIFPPLQTFEIAGIPVEIVLTGAVITGIAARLGSGAVDVGRQIAESLTTNVQASVATLRRAPDLSFAALPANVGAGDDTDPNTAGVQIVVTVNLNHDNVTGFANCTIANAMTGETHTVAFATGVATATLTMQNSPGGTVNTVQASSTNSYGNTIVVQQNVVCTV